MELKNIEFGNNYVSGGDFNTTMGYCEKTGGSKIHDNHQEYMEDLILALALYDLKPQKLL